MADEQTNGVLPNVVTYMACQPATAQAHPGEQFLILSLEVGEGKIDQLCITHEEGKQLLGDLLEALRSQGCVVAEVTTDFLNELYYEDDDADNTNTEPDGEEVDTVIDEEYGPEDFEDFQPGA